MHNYIFNTISGVINAREQAGLVAFVILVWASLQCFITLIVAANRAWGTVGLQKLVASTNQKFDAARHYGKHGSPGNGIARTNENSEKLVLCDK